MPPTPQIGHTNGKSKKDAWVDSRLLLPLEMEVPSMSKESKTPRGDFSAWLPQFACALALILIVHLTADRAHLLLSDWFGAGGLSTAEAQRMEAVERIIPWLKAALSLAALIVLLVPVFTDARRIWQSSDKKYVAGLLLTAVGVFIILELLNFQVGVGSMGEEYSRRALSPFTQGADWYSTRFLMPVMAYFLFLRGTWLYYIFSAILTVVFIALLLSWNRKRGGLAFWQFISLCTSSFVLFQFQYPGYSDILVFILFLLVMRDDFSEQSKLSFLILALLAYETSFIVGVILAWRYLGRKGQVIYLALLVLYGILWVSLAGRGGMAILFSHNVSNKSGLMWLYFHPLRELFGVFIAFKLTWLLIAAAVIVAWRSRAFQEMTFILAIVGAGLVITFLAVDTSRLMGFAFPALLCALTVLGGALSGKGSARLLSAVWILNLLIPSVYMGMNTGINTWPGLYGWLYHTVIGRGDFQAWLQSVTAYVM
jgi:hypothetical protein